MIMSKEISLTSKVMRKVTKLKIPASYCGCIAPSQIHFLKSHLALRYPIDKGADAYVAEWSKSAIPLGLTNAPMSVAELEATLDDFRANDLAHGERTDEVVRFILNPPFGGAGKFFYKVISNAAIATLDQRELDLLGLTPRSKMWLRISRISLDIFLAILGPEPPAMQVARERIARS
jgi:hypothetical protein